jgi:hypothetical protein
MLKKNAVTGTDAKNLMLIIIPTAGKSSDQKLRGKNYG